MIKSYQSAAGEMGIFYVENCSRLTVTVLKITINVYNILYTFCDPFLLRQKPVLV